MIENRLRDLRLARGWTLEDLASRMNGAVTKQALSKFEQGKSFPRPTTLVAIAKALDVKAAELIREPSFAIECLQYRLRAPLPPRTAERVEAALRVNLERRLRLEERFSSGRRPSIPIRRDVSTLHAIEAEALNLRGEWGLGRESIANLSEVLESNGVHIFELPGEIDFDALAAIAKDEDGAIRAVGIAENPDTDGDRQRFNLAHELGHVVLAPTDELDEESAANRFAGALLAPADLVRAEVGDRRSDVSWDELLLLKKRWGMSVQAILHRLVDLEIISHAHYQWWCTEIQAMGYRKREPIRLEREVSTWEQRHVARARAEGLISREAAAAYETTVSPEDRRVDLDRRALMKLPLSQRRALMSAAAEAVEAEYSALDKGWLDLDLGEWDESNG